MKNLLTFAGMLACVLFSFTAFGQNINIPDANFKNALVSMLCVDTDGDNIGDADADIDNDGEIAVSEALIVTVLGISERSIQSLDGIQYFTNLQTLSCNNNQLTSLNLSNLINLRNLYCISNNLHSLNVQGCTNLQIFECSSNQLSSLNVQNLMNLRELNCYYNQLTSLNVQGCANLQIIACQDNQLSSLNVQNLTSLHILFCSRNRLSSLNMEGCASLEALDCSENQLTNLYLSDLTNLISLNCINNLLISINVHNLTNLQHFWCDNNQLISLFIKNGRTDYVDFFANPNLTYICCDESELTYIQNKAVNEYGYINCVVTTACLVSTDQNETISDLIAQPNPTTNYIQFTTTAALQKAEVFDNLGRLLQTSSINNNQISIGTLANGLYFIKVYAREGVSVQKIIKE